MSKKAGRKTEDRADLQRAVAKLDRELLRLINERAKLVQRAGRAGNGGPLHSAVQQQCLTEICEANRGPLDVRAIRAVFRELTSGCRALVQPIRVAYLGPQYSYTYLATIHHFGESCELSPVATIAAVFEELSRGQARIRRRAVGKLDGWASRRHAGHVRSSAGADLW